MSWYLTPEVAIAGLAGMVGSAPVWSALAERVAESSAGGSRLTAAASGLTVAALAAVFAGCVMLIAAHTYNPFIYFRF
jgi:alginate O-acetyltransferase complex protein AlgI